MAEKRSYSFDIPHRERFDRWAHVTNDLYNQALYELRRELDATGKWLFYLDLNRLMPTIKNLEGECNYRLIPTSLAQQTLRILEKDINGYVQAVKDWAKHPEKYRGYKKPELPKFRKPGGTFVCAFPRRNGIRIKDGRLRLPLDEWIDIPQYEKYRDRLDGFKQVLLVQHERSINVQIIYDAPEVSTAADTTRYAAIDMGVDNLMAMVTPSGCWLYGGEFLDSYDRDFFARFGPLQAEQERQGTTRLSRRQRLMYDKRRRYMDDVMHKYSRMVVTRLQADGVGTLIVGHMKRWKDGSEWNKTDSRRFMMIPHSKLRTCLEYMCRDAGIRYVETEEGYTSKCDALSMEPMQWHEHYMGRRVKRGLFRSATGTVLNADINGALNIMRKVTGDDYVRRLLADGLNLSPTKTKHPF